MEENSPLNPLLFAGANPKAASRFSCQCCLPGFRRPPAPPRSALLKTPCKMLQESFLRLVLPNAHGLSSCQNDGYRFIITVKISRYASEPGSLDRQRNIITGQADTGLSSAQNANLRWPWGRKDRSKNESIKRNEPDERLRPQNRSIGNCPCCRCLGDCMHPSRFVGR